MFKINKLPLLLFSLLGYFIILFSFSGSVTPPAYGFDSSGSIPSLGKGPFEVVILTDYFCPPCKRIDIKAEPLLKELLATNKVKITFIDVPFHKATPIYAKYYLYAANASSDVNNILQVRKVLFEAAQIKSIHKENALVDFLKEQKILWKKLDEKSIFPVLSKIIKNNKIDQTPTCIIKYSATDEKKYIGDDKIWDGLTALKKHLSAGKK